MGSLTEQEIFDCIRENLREAAEACEDLAKRPRKGLSYDRLRKHLLLIEGAARQAAAWRADARWLPLGMQCAEAHKRAGDWLRGIRVEGRYRKIPEGQRHPLFMRLAELLRFALSAADRLQGAATNTIGPILPQVGPRPFRETRQHRGIDLSIATKTPGGILIPSGASVQ